MFNPHPGSPAGQKYCTSCGSPIPDGQGKSCSMCYGDIDYGRDGYYRQWVEDRGRREPRDDDSYREREEIDNG